VNDALRKELSASSRYRVSRSRIILTCCSWCGAASTIFTISVRNFPGTRAHVSALWLHSVTGEMAPLTELRFVA
jgi:hypothetical protein